MHSSVSHAQLLLASQEVASMLHEDGHGADSIAPELIRLAWHSAGSYDKAAITDGSKPNGAMMHFTPGRNPGTSAGAYRRASVVYR